MKKFFVMLAVLGFGLLPNMGHSQPNLCERPLGGSSSFYDDESLFFGLAMASTGNRIFSELSWKVLTETSDFRKALEFLLRDQAGSWALRIKLKEIFTHINNYNIDWKRLDQSRTSQEYLWIYKELLGRVFRAAVENGYDPIRLEGTVFNDYQLQALSSIQTLGGIHVWMGSGLDPSQGINYWELVLRKDFGTTLYRFEFDRSALAIDFKVGGPLFFRVFPKDNL